jgi:hypothetical protein
VAQFLYDWQTLIAGVLAVGAAAVTIWATINSANREVAASQAQTAIAQKQIETTLQLERQHDARRERDRADRAEVVAFRLSGWLSEVGSRLQLKSEAYAVFHKHNPNAPPQPYTVVMQWKLDLSGGIESVMQDLHYLKSGAGDLAQIDFHVRYFDAYLDAVHVKGLGGVPYSAGEFGEIYKNIGDQLTHMRELHATAERHLNPIIDAAIKRER